MPHLYPPDPKDVLLSDEEMKTIILIVDGHRAKDIAKALGFTRKQLGVVYADLLKILDKKSWTAVAVWAVRNKLT